MHHNDPRPVVQPVVKSVEQKKEIENEEKGDETQQSKAKPETSKDKPEVDESDGEDEKSRKDICSPRVCVGFWEVKLNNALKWSDSS